MSDSDSDFSDFNPRSRSKQRKKVSISKQKPKIISSESDEYSSEEQYSGSDNGDEDNQEDDDDNDDQNDNASSGDNKNNKPNDGVPSGFELPGVDQEPKIFVLVGGCASGKSYMLKYMMSLYGARRQFKFGLCMTGSKFTDSYNYLPDRSVIDIDMDYLEKYIKHLRGKIEVGKKEHGKDWNLPHNFVIIDDGLGLTNSTGFFNNFMASHRHTKTTVFILSQQLTAARSVSTVVRANTSFAMMWNTHMLDAFEGLWKNYGQMFTKKDFRAQLKLCDDRAYSCLIFKNGPSYTTPEEAYCRIAAPADVTDFELKF